VIKKCLPREIVNGLTKCLTNERRVKKANVVAGNESGAGKMEFLLSNDLKIKKSVRQFAKEPMTQPITEIHEGILALAVIEIRASMQREPAQPPP
jgi:hypothetical protein